MYLPFSTPFNEFYHFCCKNVIDFHPGHFCPVWNKKTNKQKKQYTGWRTNKCFTGGVSAVAPVDAFQQDCHKINNPNLSAQRNRWPQVLGVCVCPQPKLPAQNYISSLCRRTKTPAVRKRAASSSFRLSSNDQLPWDNHLAFESALFLPLPSPCWCAPVHLKGPSSLRECYSLLWSRVERFYFASFQASLSTSSLLSACSWREKHSLNGFLHCSGFE